MIPKFRAWDKKHARFTNYQIWDNMVFFYEKHLETWKRDDERDRFELMQSTGLKDINGVEIFEGDILISGYESKHTVLNDISMWIEEKGVVVFKDYGFKLECNSYTLSFEEIDKTDLEVVGNIYENEF